MVLLVVFKMVLLVDWFAQCTFGAIIYFKKGVSSTHQRTKTNYGDNGYALIGIVMELTTCLPRLHYWDKECFNGRRCGHI